MPSGIPAHLQRQLEADVKEATLSADTAKQINTIQYVPSKGSREDFDKFLRDELEKWGKIIREHNLTGE